MMMKPVKLIVSIARKKAKMTLIEKDKNLNSKKA